MKRERKEIQELTTDNKIGDEGARTMSETLKGNTTLTELYLRGEEEERRGREKEKRERRMNDRK